MSDTPEIAAWKVRHGIEPNREINHDELKMAAEESQSKAKAWCLVCDKHMPVKEMKLITRAIDAYKQIDDGPSDYISKRLRVRMCPECFRFEYEAD